MPIEFSLGEVGKDRAEERITAPLPVLGLGFDVAITPKWILKNSAVLFYVESFMSTVCRDVIKNLKNDALIQ